MVYLYLRLAIWVQIQRSRLTQYGVFRFTEGLGFYFKSQSSVGIPYT